jgi:predicted DNA-binding transcriptional regulator YafY
MYFIDRRIASGKYPSTRQLADDYEVGTATISRDIEFLRDMMGAPIEYDTKHRGYYYSDKSYRLPGAFTRAEDLLALGVAKNLLTMYQDTPLYKPARELLDSLTAPLGAEGETLPWYEDRIIVPGIPAGEIPQDKWDDIIGALRENRIITFDYLGIQDKKFQSRKVHPYQLLFDNGLWHLYAYAEKRKAIRIFSLSRMKNIRVTKETFKLPKDHDYRSHSQEGRFGIFTGGKAMRFRIALYDEAIPFAADRQWAADQKIKTKNGATILEFTSVQLEKVLEWVLSQGCAAQPLEPVRLVELWRINVENMGKML